MNRASGQLAQPIKETITKNSGFEIAFLFSELNAIRNRIIHSFQITSSVTYDYLDKDKQILATKCKNGSLRIITKNFLLNFLSKNEMLSTKLHEFRRIKKIIFLDKTIKTRLAY